MRELEISIVKRTEIQLTHKVMNKSTEEIRDKIEKIIEIDAWKEGVSFKDTEDQILFLLNKEIEKERKYIAFCSCGDSLERTGLYPNEAKYYCSGCDKTYTLAALNRRKE